MKPARKSIPQRPFVTISPSFLASQWLRPLPGWCLRLLLFAEANWTPKSHVVLPISHVSKQLRMSRSTVIKSIEILKDTGILSLYKPAKRPLTPGGAGRGEAAIYQMPGRTSGHAKDRKTGDPIYCGWWKVWSSDLRSAVEELGDAATKVWVCAVLPCNRDTNGLPQGSSQISLSGGQIEELLPDISARTAQRAIKRLLEVGLIRQVEAAAGCRAGLYERIGASATCIARRRRRRGHR